MRVPLRECPLAKTDCAETDWSVRSGNRSPDRCHRPELSWFLRRASCLQSRYNLPRWHRRRIRSANRRSSTDDTRSNYPAPYWSVSVERRTDPVPTLYIRTTVRERKPLLREHVAYLSLLVSLHASNTRSGLKLQTANRPFYARRHASLGRLLQRSPFQNVVRHLHARLYGIHQKVFGVVLDERKNETTKEAAQYAPETACPR